jgi:hypothetical protein
VAPPSEQRVESGGDPSDSSLVPVLITELQAQANLSEVDAYRAAFAALALADGWSKARIGRYLGISRARVGQKIDKLFDYTIHVEVPQLKAVLARASEAKAQQDAAARMVEFEPEDWRDLEWARQMCEIPGRE